LSKPSVLLRVAQRRLARIRAAQKSADSDAVLIADPVEFIEEKLGDKLWSRQRQLTESTWANTITGCISGQKTGKTRVASDIAITWCKGHRDGIVRLASASEDQLIDGLWGEIRRKLLAHPELGPPPALAPATGWRLSEEQKIIGVTAKEANRAAGRSGPEQLWIVDEACGIPYELWEVILGNLMGGGHLLWLTNPVSIGGKVYEWDTNPDSAANVVRVDARETPNFEFGPNCEPNPDYTGEAVPGLATPEGVETIRRDYGEDSAEFDVRVRGRFPRAGSNVVIPLGLVEDGIARWSVTPAEGPLVIGVDVARFGDDDSCIAPRRGQKVFDPVTVHGLDTVALSGSVVDVATQHRRHNERVTLVVECNGVGGGVVDTLLALESDWITVLSFDAGSKADDDEKYVNRRSEMWFAGQAFLKDGGAIPDSQRLKGELIAPTYGFDTRARRKVESKDDIKKKTKRSPDVADAVLLSITTAGDSSLTGSADLEHQIFNDSRWSSFSNQKGY
jgi:phage terminase large subunit